VRFKSRGIFVSAVIKPLGLVVLFLLSCPTDFSSEKYRGEIVFREEVSARRRDELARRLRVITGWRDLNFDFDGRLQIGTAAAENGSQLARTLIGETISRGKILVLEDASNRADVVFARVIPGRWKNQAAEKPAVFVVLIDFADFDHLMGDQQALEAFDVGWGLLHEIDHVVNDSSDADRLGRTGECETHINQMRRECNLPQRTEYLSTFFPHAEESTFKTRLVRLAFEQEDAITKNQRRYWLIWDATQVGGLDSAREIAASPLSTVIHVIVSRRSSEKSAADARGITRIQSD
jgi:hypothetical protein